MTGVITCDAFHDPFKIEGWKNTIGVQLNFELWNEHLPTSASAENLYKDFLDALPGTRFFLYRLAGNKLELAGELDRSAGLPAGQTDAIMKWLKASKAPWHQNRPEDGELRNAVKLSAGQLLSGAQTWPAPLPQEAGLNRLLGFDGDASGDGLYIVPFPWLREGENPELPAEDVTVGDDKSVTIRKPWGDEKPDLEVASLRDHIPVDGVEQNGFLAVDSISQNELALAEALQRKSASLFWTAPQLIALVPPIPGEATAEENEAQQRLLALESLVNRAKITVASLLDTFLLALVMPCKTDNPGSPDVLGPIVQSVLATAEEIRFEDEAGPDSRYADSYELNLEQFPRDLRTWADGLVSEWNGYLDQLGILLDQPAAIAKPNEDKENNPLQRLQSGKPLLGLILRLAKPDQESDDPGPRIEDPGPEFDFAAADAQIDQELSELVQIMGEEKAFEAAILNFLQTARLNGEDRLIESIFEERAGVTETVEKDYVASLPAKMISRISAYYDDHYNALEAARQAAGRIYARAYLDAVRAASVDASPPALKDFNWYTLRTTGKSKGGVAPATLFDDILDVLPRFDDAPLSAGDSKLLKEAWDETCAELGTGELEPERRFVPDSHPADLKVFLPLPPTRQDDDQFEQQYDGIGMLVRQWRGENFGPWAHVNLANLSLKHSPKADQHTSILPAQPAYEDGERSITFDYRGHFLVFDQLEDPDPIEDESPEPLYEPIPPELTAGFAKLPPLAYGTAYEIAAYAISRNGVLPNLVSIGATAEQRLQVKLDLELPENPENPDVEFPEAGKEGIPVQCFHYSRRTGIGQAVLQRSSSEKAPPRFDQNSVLPLAYDYPRVGLSGRSGSKVWLDLWRREDGSGAIAMPQAKNEVVELWIKDIRVEERGKLSLKLFTSAIADPETQVAPSPKLPTDEVHFSLDSLSGNATLTIQLKWENDMVVLNANGKECKAPAGKRGWIRLVLEADNGLAQDQLPTVTFADPAGELKGSSGGDARDSKDFLLMRPESKNWNDDFPDKASYDLMLPSMAPSDLDRWLSNPVLLGEAGGDPTKEDDSLKKLQKMLLGIVVDEGEDAASLLRDYTGFLPDLAVKHLQAELIVLDEFDTRDTENDQHEVENPKATFADISPKTLPELIADAEGVPIDDDGYIDLSRLEGFLKKIAEERTISVKVAPGDKKPELHYNEVTKDLTVKVAPGQVAMLRIRIAIPEKHFTPDSQEDENSQSKPDNKIPVIDPRYAQFSTGRTTHCLLFDGPTLRIEVMHPPDASVGQTLRDLTGSGLTVQSAPGSRAYRLEFDPQDEAAWKWCGRADVTSQRWRPMGRPQSAWFNPRHGQEDQSGPVIQLKSDIPGLEAFEQEAFYRREDDALTGSVRLEPLGQSSVLHEGEWELPSATMFRHRVTLQNRYAPAMRTNAGKAWPVVAAKSEQYKWSPHQDWLRMVVLADQDRVRLTRPQLRAIMPLPVAEANAASPPLLAMLSEPPFADGGLADRVAAGVATAVGYEMKAESTTASLGETEEPDQSERLAVTGMQQEFGPDPQHGYVPLGDDFNGAVGLEGAGPIGMTFDREAGTSAAFTNSAWLLTPTPLADWKSHEFEEHFASVRMQRYLAHEWVMRDRLAETKSDGEKKEEKDGTAFAQTLWFEKVEPGTSLYCGDREVLKVDKDPKDEASWRVRTWPIIVLPTGPESGDMLTVSRFSDAGRVGCALLHQPLDNTRAVLSVFAVEPGRMPLLMASFEWDAKPKPPEQEQAGERGTDEHVQATTLPDAAPEDPKPGKQQTLRFMLGEVDLSRDAARISASLVTDMHWARTGRDVDRLSVVKLDDSKKRTIFVRTKDLWISNSEVRLRDGPPLWLRPSLHDMNVPLYKQRFLAYLQTQPANGPGGKMQVYNPDNPVRALLLPRLNNALNTAGSQVQLLEIECPARPLGCTSIKEALPIPPEYERPSIDLRECGIEKSPWLIAMIRPSGKHCDINDKSIKFSVESGNTTLSFSLSGEREEEPPEELAGIDMAFLAIDRTGEGHAAWQIFRDGEVKGLTVQTSSRPVTHDVAFKVESSEEWWGNVTLLSAKTGPAPELQSNAEFGLDFEIDFDWMFGGATDEEGKSLEDSLSHAGLRRTRGAQARILSISHPIAVQA